MFSRLARIRREFGNWALFQALLLLSVVLWIVPLSFATGAGVQVAVATSVVLVAGFFLREVAIEHVERGHVFVNGAVAAYFVVILMGDAIGIDRATSQTIIASTSAALFSYHFWVRSDPRVTRVSQLDDFDDDEWERG